LPSIPRCPGQAGAPPDSEQCVISFHVWRSRPLQPPVLPSDRWQNPRGAH
jgi:hypothetical protein